MAFDEDLAARVRDELISVAEIGEIKMFGGLCFTLRGNMCLGVVKDELMVRFDPAREDEAMALPGARPMDFSGKPMKGFLFVSPDGLRTARALRQWVALALAFVGQMPPKKPRKKK